MPLDNIFLEKLVFELKEFQGLYIDKISMGLSGEIIFFIKRKKLVISLPLSFITVTEEKIESAEIPGNFCMLLRKYLQGGKIEKTEKMPLARIVKSTVLKRDDLFEIKSYDIFIELFGSKSNFILIKDNKIIDSFFRSDLETQTRIIAPGAIYTPPENTSLGYSPLINRELEFRNCKIEELLKNAKPTVLADRNGNYKDFTFTEIKQYGNLYNNIYFKSYAELINNYFSTLVNKRKNQNLSGKLKKTVKNAISRTEKKLILRKKDLANAEKSEDLRICGELIKANIYKIKKGESFILAENYYNNNKEIKIKLNPAKSPQENAAKYFKDYKKSCNAVKTLAGLIEECEKELEYLYSVNEELTRAHTVSDMNAIKEELRFCGILKGKNRNQNNKSNKNGGKNGSKRKIAEKIKEEEYLGFKILIGRNNLENDQLTLKKADKQDIWFHTKNIPGSHVVIVTNGKEVPNDVIMFAARIAAKNSAAKLSSGVAVDYTKIKNVKKPAGAKPGMVIYKTNKTVFVTP